MNGDRFVYVTYIRATAEQLWTALTDPDFTARYWFGVRLESTWKEGAGWKMAYRDGRVTDLGEVLEVEKPHRLVLSWRHQWREDLKAEGEVRATFTLEPAGEMVKLTVVHESPRAPSKVIEAVSGGWPQILSSLKSLLETGAALPRPQPAPASAA